MDFKFLRGRRRAYAMFYCLIVDIARPQGDNFEELVLLCNFPDFDKKHCQGLFCVFCFISHVSNLVATLGFTRRFGEDT